MKTLLHLPEVPGLWELSFDAAPGGDGILLEIRCAGAAVLTFSREGGLCARLRTRWNADTPRFGKDPSFTFELRAAEGSGHVRLLWREYVFRLYIDGVLADEDWPLGRPERGAWSIEAADGVSGLAFGVPGEDAGDLEISFDGSFQNYNHPGANTGVGDCMPFARDGRWCLYYLLDRRGHASKQHLGAHQWAQVSTADLKHWTIHPMAVGITEQWEGSICTGSLITKDGKTWAFYAVRMSDGSPARLTWAVSGDGVHFEKSGRYFALTDPYEPVSARDPNVFLGADGQYHMLVTTSLTREGRFGGCLAHLTSPDLENWKQQDPFIVPGYSDQPECSDYFEWNGWYYLVFSNFAVARYRMSRRPFGPWIRPENDLLDALEIQVPKTAPFGDRRFSAGFLARRPRSYAGNAVTHELFQRADGTLGVKQAEEILPQAAYGEEFPPVHICAGEGRNTARFDCGAGAFRLRMRLKASGTGVLYGLIVHTGGPDAEDSRAYRIELDPAARMAVIVRPKEDFMLGAGRDQLRGVDLRGEVPVDLLVMGDILDVILADGRAMTMRMDAPVGHGAFVEAYALCGGLDVLSAAVTRFATE